MGDRCAGEFPGFTNIEKEEGLSGLDRGVEIDGGDFRMLVCFVAAAGPLQFSKLMDACLGAAERAAGVEGEFKALELVMEKVTGEQLAGKADADSGQKFDRFGGHQTAAKAGEDAEDACFITIGDAACIRSFGEKAAITGEGGAGIEEGDLGGKLVDGAKYQGPLGKKTGVVGEIAGGEIVRAVDDESVGLDQLPGIVELKTLLQSDDFDMGVVGPKSGGESFGFWSADIRSSESDLTVQVAFVDGIGVDQGDATNSGGGEIGSCWATQAAGPDDED